MLSWPGIFLMLQNQVISSFSLSKSVHPQSWWYDWMRSILTLTSELCECFAKVPVTIFQSLNGGIRNRVVIFIILNLGRAVFTGKTLGCHNIFLRYFKYLKTLYYYYYC